MHSRGVRGLTHGLGLAGLVVLATVAGCASQSASQPGDDEIHFPDRDTAWREEGTFVNVDNYFEMRPGLTKDQVYDLLGRPHFSEGLFGVREWNYIFHFRTGDEPHDYWTCQYQVRFGDDMSVESFHRNDSECLLVLTGRDEQPVTRLSADVLFAFDEAVLTDGGVKEVQALAEELEADFGAPELLVVGHTDRLGAEGYNMQLSQRRADAVRRELIASGVSPWAIRSFGAGEHDPLVECEGEERTPELKECLQPNRRVEVKVIDRQ